ncbi:MAG: hypothetical protein WBY94_17075, partial [Polyangiaceae bacterium]
GAAPRPAWGGGLTGASQEGRASSSLSSSSLSSPGHWPATPERGPAQRGASVVELTPAPRGPVRRVRGRRPLLVSVRVLETGGIHLIPDAMRLEMALARDST